MNNNYKSYSLNIWLMAVLVPPLLLFLPNISGRVNESLFDFLDFIQIYTFVCLIAALFSFVPFLIFQSFNKYLFNNIIKDFLLKITINLQAIFWGFSPFLIFYLIEFGLDFNFNLNNRLFKIFSSYFVIISGGVWFFKIERDETLFNNEIQDDLLDDDFNFKK